MIIVEFLKVLLLGIVEGFTEWLPISSTGHMILVDELVHLSVEEPFRELFLVVIQLGAILAVVLLYWDRLNPFTHKRKRQRRVLILWSKIIAAVIPAAIAGFLLDDYMDKLMNGFVVALMLILYGVIFILLEKKNYRRVFPSSKVSQIDYRTAVLIGCFQCLALIPGTSRSGATILGAMILGCSRGVAAQFSFFLGIPVMFGASLLKIVKYFAGGNMFSVLEFFYLFFGMIVAFLVSVFSIRFLVSYVKKHDFTFFGYYRIVLGAFVLLYFGVSALVS